MSSFVYLYPKALADEHSQLGPAQGTAKGVSREAITTGWISYTAFVIIPSMHAAPTPPRAPNLRQSLWLGSVGFCAVSLVVFGSWAWAGRWLVSRLGEKGAYAVWTFIFILGAGGVFNHLVVGPRRLGRFYTIFTLAFLSYAVAWTVAWFVFRNRAGEWLASFCGTAALGLVLCAVFSAWQRAVKIALVLFATHSVGYFVGEWFYAAIGGPAGKLLWGAAYGLGFGLGLGYAFYHCQEKHEPPENIGADARSDHRAGIS